MSIPDDHQDLNPTGFDPSFATASGWAEMYRALSLQVVPCKDKRPDLHQWAGLQETLAPDFTFGRWYGTGGEHLANFNMGIITGPCSGNVIVVDLDDHTHPEAARWWNDLIEYENNGIDLETPEQRTGGGGRQKLFRAPAGRYVPTRKTAIGVDIRGTGGFAVMPPTMHSSGRRYEWIASPVECAIQTAPEWLLEAIDDLIEAHGGDQGPSPKRTGSPSDDYTAFGSRQDGREEEMFRTLWHTVLEWYRECPIQPSVAEWEARSLAGYEVYEAKVVSRHPDLPKREGLEKDGRGPSAWAKKWRREMRNWGSPKMQREAAKPRPQQEPPDLEAEFEAASEKAKASGKTFELFDVAQIKAWPPPKWMIEKLVIEQSLGFIFGPPGSLKTFIALDIALSLATRQGQWWGYKIDGGGAVLYISVEGNANLPFRIKAWEQNRQIAADTAPFYLIKQSVNFLKAEDVGVLLATIEEAAARAKQPIIAIFVDTVSRVLPGAKENLQEDMTIFVNACTAVREKYGSVVIGIHHANAQGGMRGSTVIPAAGDFIIETRREAGAMFGSIYAKKVKDGDDGWERFFEVKKITTGDIKGTVSLAVDGISSEPLKPQSSQWPERDTLRQILAAITEEWLKGKPWCFSKNTSRSATRNISKRWRLDVKLVDDILAEWTANGIIAEEVRDTKTHIVGYRKLTDI